MKAYLALSMKAYLALSCLLALAVLTSGCNHHDDGHHGHHKTFLPENEVKQEGECGLSICVDDLFPPVLFQILDFFLNNPQQREELTGQRKAVDGGNPVDEMVGQFCLDGTAMGDKMEAALKSCSNSSMEKTGRKANAPKGNGKKGKGKKGKGKGGKGKGKGKGKGGSGKCPDSEEIIEKIQSETAAEHCVMKEMGWVDSEGRLSYLGEIAQADLQTLQPSVAENIAQKDIEKCINDKVSTLKEGSLYQRCEDKYTEEDKSKLKDVINDKILLKCSKEVFVKSCSNYVARSFMSCMTNN